MRGYPQFSFWISVELVKIYISSIIINRGKNTFELEGMAEYQAVKGVYKYRYPIFRYYRQFDVIILECFRILAYDAVLLSFFFVTFGPCKHS